MRTLLPIARKTVKDHTRLLRNLRLQVGNLALALVLERLVGKPWVQSAQMLQCEFSAENKPVMTPRYTNANHRICILGSSFCCRMGELASNTPLSRPL